MTLLRCNIISDPELQTTTKSLKQKLKAWMHQQGDLGKETEARAKERIKDTPK